MEIIANTTDFYLEKETAVALGKFDGIHIGHRRLLQEILQKKEEGLLSCVFTFDPPPTALFGGGDGKELTTREEKRLLFERMGVDVLIEFPLNPVTAATSPEDFVRGILAKRLKTRYVAAGEDVSFGAGGRGNAKLLEKMERVCGYGTSIIEKVSLDGQVVSSTYVRRQVEAGNMLLAGRLLGMPYTVMGCVVHGRRLGRTLGMPTVNLLPPPQKLLPPCGVYQSTVRCGTETYHAISNVGYKPTVTSEHIMGLESYLYDFSGELYGEFIEVALQEFRRPERRFASVEELKAQLQEDVGQGWTERSL